MKKLRACLVVLAAFVLTAALSVSAYAAKADEKHQEIAKRIADEYNKAHPTEPVETVKTMSWIAKLKSKVKVTTEENGDVVKLKAGKKVTVIQRDYHAAKGTSEVRLPDGQTCYIPNRYLTFTKPVCTGAAGDYSDATKLAYINGQLIQSATEYLIWISLDKQRVYIFRGTPKNWALVAEAPGGGIMKASSGAGESPTLDNTFCTYYYIKWKKPAIDSMTWFSSFYGSGIHRFVGPGKYNMGKKPISHSCVRVTNNNAKWVFNNIPLKTRVWIW